MPERNVVFIIRFDLKLNYLYVREVFKTGERGLEICSPIMFSTKTSAFGLICNNFFLMEIGGLPDVKLIADSTNCSFTEGITICLKIETNQVKSCEIVEQFCLGRWGLIQRQK